MKKITIFVLLFLSSNLFSLNLKLKENAIISGEKIILKDIVEVINDKNNEWNKIKNYCVGSFSLTSSKTVIPLARLINISKELNLNFSNLSSLTVIRNVNRITDDKIKQLIENYILSRNKDIKIVSVHSPETLFIPATANLSVDRVSSSTLCGNFPLTLVVIDNETGNKIKYVNVRITTIADFKVAIAEKDIKRGEELNLTNLRFESREFKNLRRNPITVNQLKNVRAKSTIKAGTIVFTNSVEDIPIVFKNEEVLVLFEDKGLSVEMKGIAKENGIMGSVINVFNPNSRKIIKALVVGDNMAQIL